MSLRDYIHERLLSICAILGLAAVLSPLLVLFGIKCGIISTMTRRLVQDPRNLEITPVGSSRYDQKWFSALKNRPETAFIIPQTRSIAANMILQSQVSGAYRTVVVDLIPTDKGDPLVSNWAKVPVDNRSIVLSEPAARKLNITGTGSITGRIGRSVSGIKQDATIDLRVIDVLPLEAMQREAAFVRLPLLEATEDYRDGIASPDFGWPGKPSPDHERVYPSFRLYARDIYDVSALRNFLTEKGIEVYTRAEEIDVVRNLDRSFSLIFQLIALVAVFGYFASMTSNVLANVNRKKRHLGVTRLIGFSTGNIIWFPIIQSILTSILGTLTAIGLYIFVESLINRTFGKYLATGEYVCRLQFFHFFTATALTVTMAMIASIYAAYQVSKIEPSEVIRDV